MATPPDVETLPLELSDEIAAAVDGAFEAGMPVMVAYVDADGWPHLSYRGTTQVFGPQQLAVWARNPEGGLPNAVRERPRVTLFFRNPTTRQTYVFYGRARIAGDPETRTAVYEHAPEFEQGMDPDRLGVAVIVDLDRVDGISPERRFRMER
jgi:hypothetical protein